MGFIIALLIFGVFWLQHRYVQVEKRKRAASQEAGQAEEIVIHVRLGSGRDDKVGGG